MSLSFLVQSIVKRNGRVLMYVLIWFQALHLFLRTKEPFMNIFLKVLILVCKPFNFCLDSEQKKFMYQTCTR